MNVEKKYAKLWLISLAVKLVLSALIPLGGDETYYWVWSHRLQLSYFDHPPMVAWLFYLGHFLEPFAQTVRWPAVILGHLTLAVWYLILKDQVDWEKQKIWIYLALFSPLLGIGSLIITPDIPVVFFWSLSLYFLLRAERNASLGNYAALGMSLGLGFCAKYHIVLFIPCLLAYLLLEKRWRQVRWSYLPLTVFFGLVFCLPVLIWNYQNEFISFLFQIHHGLSGQVNPWESVSIYVIGQILILFPLIFWAALRAKVPSSLRALLYFGWGPFLFFLWSSTKNSGEANWAIIAYPAVLALALFGPHIRGFLKIYMVFWGALLAAALLILAIPPWRQKVDPLNEAFLYRSFSPLVTQYQPLYAQSHQLAAALWYYSKIPTYKLHGMNQRYDFFDSLAESHPSANVFYLLTRKDRPLPEWMEKEHWQENKIQDFAPNFELLKFAREP